MLTAEACREIGGTCSCRVVVLPSISQETAKEIVLSLGPAIEPKH